MNTKGLRQKILDMAIHGKLVSQNPNDESAEVLLEKIRAEKAEKIKSGELKADKKDSFIFVGSDKRHYEQFTDGSTKDIEDEIPFELPAGWAWCRIFNIATTELGKTLDARKNKGDLYDYLCALNVKWYTFDFSTLKQIRIEKNEKERYLVKKGDLLICEGGDVGRSAIWNSDKEIYYQNALHRVRFYNGINQYFFLYILNYYKNIGLIDEVSGGVTIKHFTQNSMQKILLPLPPLAEQKRIVGKIEEIFAQIDALEQNKVELQCAIKQAKAKILDLAIHGKLVPQEESDESAEVLLERIRAEKAEKIKNGELKADKKDSFIFVGSDKRHYEQFTDGSTKDIEDEIPFELPAGWAWVKLGDICDYGKCLNVSSENLKQDDWILDLEDIEKDTGKIIAFHTFGERKSESTKHKFFKGQVLYSKLRPYLNKVVIAPKDGFCTSEILPLDFNGIFENKFAQILLMSSYFLGVVNMLTYGVKMPRLGTGEAKKILIPLPPLAEQKRIVGKIEELFEQLDSIAMNLG